MGFWKVYIGRCVKNGFQRGVIQLRDKVRCYFSNLGEREWCYGLGWGGREGLERMGENNMFGVRGIVFEMFVVYRR